MINLCVNNEFLDVPIDAEVVLESVNFRFCDNLRDAFTNDFELPKTNRNIRILECSGLLDAVGQPLAHSFDDVTMTVGDRMYRCKLQVASVTPKVINVCVIEKTPIDEYKDKSIGDLYVDGDTVWPWNVNSVQDYPDVFRAYEYGDFKYNANAAQYHPSLPLNGILQGISPLMPVIPDRYRLIANRKVLNPNIRTQVIQGSFSSMDGKIIKINGGQHITNDLEWSKEGSTLIKYNRSVARADIRLWFATWTKTATIYTNQQLYVIRRRSGVETTIATRSVRYTSPKIELWQFSATDFREGDEIYIRLTHAVDLRTFSFLAEFKYDGYYIEEENDYDVDLKYVGQLPRLIAVSSHNWSDDGWDDGVYHNDGEPMVSSLWFDGGTRTLVFDRGDRNPRPVAFATPALTFCHISYYLCLPEIKIGKLLYDLQWVLGKRLTVDARGRMHYVSLDETSYITNAYIDGMATASEHLGKRNYLMHNGEEAKHAVSVTDIDNDFLSDEHNLLSSDFALNFREYSNPETDPTILMVECDYDERDGVHLGAFDGVAIRPVSFSHCGFRYIDRCVEANITVNDPIGDPDYIYLDGHKYMVIDVSHDLKEHTSEVNALLVSKRVDNSHRL